MLHRCLLHYFEVSITRQDLCTYLSSVSSLCLTFWCVLSVRNQLVTLRTVFSSRITHLIPRWTFFAPHPVRGDLHVLFRCVHPDETVSEWREASVVNERSLFTSLWNPKKRVCKGIIELTRGMLASLQSASSTESLCELPSSQAYAAMVEIMFLLPAPSETPEMYSCSRQFAVLESYGFVGSRPSNVLIVSSVHAAKDLAS